MFFQKVLCFILVNPYNAEYRATLGGRLEDIDKESERNANGTMQRTRVATKRKLTVEWPPLSNSEISKILGALSDVFFTVKYPDPMVGGITTKTFYSGDRTAPVLKVINGVTRWEGLKTNLVEK